MQCNIDQRGARIRQVWGTMNLFAAVVLAGLAWWTGMWWLWGIAGVCTLAGAFAIFEAKKRWCVVRAMGIKTSI